MRAKAKPIAPLELEPRAEHPHRCTAGHRWQHDGPAATTCALPIYDAVSGDLPFVRPEDCPLCSGRNDLLVRKRHTHYCNICDGDWEHEGRCLDSLSACCPWCFPKSDVETIPGARSGPHFHVCAECGQNWRHATGCGEALRTALLECPWCRSSGPPIEADAVGVNTVEVDAVAADTVEAEPSLSEPTPAMPSVGARARGAGRRRPVARAIGIAALVLLPIAIAIVLRSHLALKSPGEVGHEAPALEARVAVPNPAPASPTPPLPPAPAPELARPPADLASPAPRTPPPAVAGVPPGPRTPALTRAPSRPPAGDRIVQPKDQEPRPQALWPRPAEARPEPVPRAPAPASSAALAPSAAPAQNVVPAPSAADAPPVSPPKPQPSVARSEPAAEAPARAPEAQAARSEFEPTPAPVRAAAPSIPGAPFGGLSGSSGLDTSLDGHPRRANR